MTLSPPMGKSLFFVQIHHFSYFRGNDMIFGMLLSYFGNRFQGFIPRVLCELELTIMPRKIRFSP